MRRAGAVVWTTVWLLACARRERAADVELGGAPADRLSDAQADVVLSDTGFAMRSASDGGTPSTPPTPSERDARSPGLDSAVRNDGATPFTDVRLDAGDRENGNPPCGLFNIWSAGTCQCDPLAGPLCGQDGFASWPVPVPGARTYRSSDGIVDDDVTGLAWEADPPDELRSWDDAREYCHALSLGNRSGWRIPSRVELLSLVEPGKLPAIDARFAVALDYYWTQTSLAGDAGKVYTVYFGAVEAGWVDRDRAVARLRCVSGSASVTRRVALADRVEDHGTHLTWQRNESPELTWEEAQTYCAGLELPDATGFRLPTLPELSTLIDDRISQLDSKLYQTTGARLWSASHDPNGYAAWTLDPTDATLQPESPTSAASARCVRVTL